MILFVSVKAFHKNTVSVTLTISYKANKKAVLSQGESCDAAVNFGAYWILQRHHMCSFSATAELSCWSLSEDCNLSKSDKY